MGFKTITELGWWFLHLTLINRVLEGQFITINEMNMVNDMMVFRQMELFGFITVPIPNLSMLTTGIPRLIKFDYSFFSGNAGFFQYALYCVSFGIMFLLFVIIIGGLISNFLGRLR